MAKRRTKRLSRELDAILTEIQADALRREAVARQLDFVALVAELEREHLPSDDELEREWRQTHDQAGVPPAGADVDAKDGDG